MTKETNNQPGELGADIRFDTSNWPPRKESYSAKDLVQILKQLGIHEVKRPRKNNGGEK